MESILVKKHLFNIISQIYEQASKETISKKQFMKIKEILKNDDLRNLSGLKQINVKIFQNSLLSSERELLNLIAEDDQKILSEHVADGYLKLANFIRDDVNYEKEFILFVLKSMCFDSEEGRQLFPSLLHLESLSSESLDIFLIEVIFKFSYALQIS